jgi:anthranilate 1,2-dioxygenase small subunit
VLASEAKLDRLMLRLEMTELLDRYVAYLDNDRLEDWAALFTDDCLYEIIPKENADFGLPAPVIHCTNARMVRDRVTSLRNANIYEEHTYRHMYSGLSVEQRDPDTVALESSYVVVNTGQEGTSSVYQAGCYKDVVVRTAEGWRFKEKRVIYDTLRVPTLLATPI